MSEAELAALRAQVLMSMKKREKTKEEMELEEGEIKVVAPPMAPPAPGPLAQTFINPALQASMATFPLVYLAQQQPLILPPSMISSSLPPVMQSVAPQLKPLQQQQQQQSRKAQRRGNIRSWQQWLTKRDQEAVAAYPQQLSQSSIEASYAKYVRDRDAAAAAAAATAAGYGLQPSQGSLEATYAKYQRAAATTPSLNSAADFLRNFEYSIPSSAAQAQPAQPSQAAQAAQAAQADVNAAAEAAAAVASYYGYGADLLGATSQTLNASSNAAGAPATSMELLLQQLAQDPSSYQQLLQWQQLSSFGQQNVAGAAPPAVQSATAPAAATTVAAEGASSSAPSSNSAFSSTTPLAATAISAAPAVAAAVPEAPPALAEDLPNEVEMEVDDNALIPPVAAPPTAPTPTAAAGPAEPPPAEPVAPAVAKSAPPVPTAAKPVAPPTRPVPKSQPSTAGAPKAKPAVLKPKQPVNESLVVHLTDSESESPAPAPAASNAVATASSLLTKPIGVEIEKLRQAIAEHEARRKQKRARKAEGSPTTKKPNKRNSLSAAEKGARAVASLEQTIAGIRTQLDRLTGSLDSKDVELKAAEQDAARVRTERDDREARVQALTAKVRAAREALRVAEQQLEAADVERAAYGTQLHAAEEAVRIRRGDILGTKVVIEKNQIRLLELDGELRLARQLVAEQLQRDALAGIVPLTLEAVPGESSLPNAAAAIPSPATDHEEEYAPAAVPIERCGGVWTVLLPNRIHQDSFFSLLEPSADSASNNNASASSVTASLAQTRVSWSQPAKNEYRFKQAYQTPLVWFKSYRLNPHYLTTHKVSSPTFSNRIDPSAVLCRFEMNGTCNDSSCQGQHSRDYLFNEHELLVDLARYAQLLPKEGGSPLAGLSPAEVMQHVGQDLKRAESSETAAEHLVSLLRAGMQSPHFIVDRARPRVENPAAASRKANAAAAQQQQRTRAVAATDESALSTTDAGTDLLTQLLADEEGRDVAVAAESTDPRYYEPSGQLSPEDFEERLQKEPTNCRLWLQYATHVEKMSGAAALRVLARALEANKTSEELWMAYLRLFLELVRAGKLEASSASELSSACADAVRCISSSAPLWLFYVSIADSVPAALTICERALRTFSSAPPSNAVRASAGIRDLLLCVLKLECDSMAPARALARVARILPPMAATPAGSASASILSDERTDVDLACARLLSVADRVSVVLHCAHIAAHRQLPLLGAEQVYFLISPPTTQSVESTARLQHARALLAAAMMTYVTEEDETSVRANVPLCLNAVHLAVAMGDFDEARAICEALVSIDPSVVEVWQWYAHAEEVSGRIQEAETAYENALSECHPVDFFLTFHYAAFLLRSRPGPAGREAARTLLARAVAQCVHDPPSNMPAEVLLVRAAYSRLAGLPSSMPKAALSTPMMTGSAYLWLCFCAFEALTNLEAEVDALFAHAQLVMPSSVDRALVQLQLAIWKRSQRADEGVLLPLVDSVLQILPHVPSEPVRYGFLRCFVTLLAPAFAFSFSDHALAALPRSLELTLTAADNALQLGIPHRARTLLWRAIHAHHPPHPAPLILYLKALDAAQQLADLDDLKNTFEQARVAHPLCPRLQQFYLRALAQMSAVTSVDASTQVKADSQRIKTA